MRRNIGAAFLAAVAVGMLALATPAQAWDSYLGSFRATYPTAAGSRIDNCRLCHMDPLYDRNPYGTAFGAAGHDFAAIRDADSDGDTYSNGAEIAALFYPGDATDHPAPPADTTPPVVTAFLVPAASTSLVVTINGITATDDTGVTHFIVTESATKPAAGDAGWTGAVPGSYTAATAGAHTLYAYAKDAAGNVSDGLAATVTITLPPGSDTTPPTVSAFTVPATAASLTVPVLSLVASDDTGVAGYLITESATRPAAGDPGWTAAVPNSFTAAADGTHTLYAYAKDAAGNVSDGLAAVVTITLATAGEPLFLDTFGDAGSKGDPNWERVRGRFIGQRGAFVSQGRMPSLSLVRGETALDPFVGGRLETDLQAINPSKGTEAGVVFDFRDKDHYRYVLINTKRRTVTIGEFSGSDGDDEAGLRGGRARTRKIKPGRNPKGWRHVTVDVDSAAGVARVYVDGSAQPAVNMTFANLGEGRVGIFVTDAARKAAFDNFKVQDVSALP